MTTKNLVKGIHHVTATVNDAQEDYHFYTYVLGMRLVKKTVNFDNKFVYHFYYANQTGTAGTIFTTFPYKNQANVKQGMEGTGQIVATALSVPMASLAFWDKRLKENGVLLTHGVRFGQPYIWFRDPSGLQIELIGNDSDKRSAWLSAKIPEITDGGTTSRFLREGVAIRGIHQVTLSIAPEHWEKMIEFLTNEMNMTVAAEENNRIRLAVNGGGAGNYLEMRLDAYAQPARNGIGTVHHVAWIVEDDVALMALRERMVARGFAPTDMRDRKYFHSVYFKPYAGMWFELATLPPGFMIDEPEETLGNYLHLPDWEEVNRAAIEARLPKLT